MTKLIEETCIQLAGDMMMMMMVKKTKLLKKINLSNRASIDTLDRAHVDTYKNS